MWLGGVLSAPPLLSIWTVSDFGEDTPDLSGWRLLPEVHRRAGRRAKKPGMHLVFAWIKPGSQRSDDSGDPRYLQAERYLTGAKQL